MQVALSLEKSVNQSIIDLHKVASSHNDAQVYKYIYFEIVIVETETDRENWYTALVLHHARVGDKEFILRIYITLL